jgi:putative ABC transport system permease protein
VRTLEDALTRQTADARFTTVLFCGFAVVGLLLAATGVYGIMAYNVSRRMHEIGIRLALGAQPSDVMRMMLLGGVKLAAVGVGAGILASVALTRFIASQLYGVTATDPAVFATVALVLMAVAVVACYLPARRATRVDPLIALRNE